MRTPALFRSASSLLLLLLLQAVAVAEAHPDLAGDWALSFGQRTLIVLTLKPAARAAQPFSGSLSRPSQFQTRDNVSFSHIAGSLEVEPIVASAWSGDALSITLQNPSDSADKSSVLLRLADAGHASMQIAGIPLPPVTLTRVTSPVTVATDWDPAKTYSPDDYMPSNAEMKRIFEEDQKVRQPGIPIDWAVVSKADAERRQATRKLLDAGALHTGEDFTLAAHLFQHGSSPNDFLLAHTLALIAVKKGDAGALWIASATLDRYLQSIRQPQIYGTQFLTPDNLPVTQEPFDRTLISDALRRQLDVPPLARQEDQKKQYEATRQK